MEKEKEGTARMHVFHLKLSSPHFQEVGRTFYFDTGTTLKELSHDVSSHIQMKVFLGGNKLIWFSSFICAAELLVGNDSVTQSKQNSILVQ